MTRKYTITNPGASYCNTCTRVQCGWFLSPIPPDENDLSWWTEQGMVIRSKEIDKHDGTKDTFTGFVVEYCPFREK